MIFSVELPRRQFALTEGIWWCGGVGGVGVGGHIRGVCDGGNSWGIQEVRFTWRNRQ